MDVAAEATPATPRDVYKSRPGALVWFFKKSRNNWKDKYQSLKANLKGLKNQLAAVTRSRQQWRTKAELAAQRVDALEAELAEVRSRIAVADQKNRTRDPAR
jgi:chromosome segregation ATPase